ncbi:MAG TPA: metallophosphoesterase family protein [bacterium]
MRSRPTLRLRPDGTFVIVQFTDTHWHNGEPADAQTRALLEHVLDAEQPDLVLLTGDVIEGSASRDPARAWLAVVEPLEARGIPWAAVFGNHDDEGTLDRHQLMAVQQSCAWCLAESGPSSVSGVGNYVLRVCAAGRGATALAVYCLDSNAYAEGAIGGYGWIRLDQIDWYVQMTRSIRDERKAPVPGLAFFHIPLPEYDALWQFSTWYGHKYEPVCCPRINTGFFAAARRAGDLMAVFVGHDHINDFEGTWHGIRLCYGRASGCQTYGRDGFLRGARVIRYVEGERDIYTWLRLEDGSITTDPPRHEPPLRRAAPPMPD